MQELLAVSEEEGTTGLAATAVTPKVENGHVSETPEQEPENLTTETAEPPPPPAAPVDNGNEEPSEPAEVQPTPSPPEKKQVSDSEQMEAEDLGVKQKAEEDWTSGLICVYEILTRWLFAKFFWLSL